MNKMTVDHLVAYTELFIKCGSGGYISDPQVYSPLYVQLYNALLVGEEPELLPGVPSLLDSELEDLKKKAVNSFDRYLIANYMSPFELSYPLPIPEKNLKDQELNKYLNQRYGKASKDADSFKKERLNKDVLSLFPEKYRDIFHNGKNNKKYRSSLFKLITLNYKLSRVNNKWKDHVRRASSSDNTHNHMDTVIAFNRLSNKVSKRSSACFMTLYYELDQSSPDGDLQNSRNIAIIPSALELIEFWVRDSLVKKWCDGFDYEERKEWIVNEIKRLIVSNHNGNESETHYDDPHHHFCDVLKTAMLCNRYHNKVLAKREFENEIYDSNECQSVFSLLLQNMSWYLQPLENKELKKIIIKSIPDIKNFDDKIFALAMPLKHLLINQIPSLSDNAANNLSVLFVVLCKDKFPRIRGSLQGSNQLYSLWGSLKEGESKINNAGEPLHTWEFESVYRPSLLHMMELVALFVTWGSNKTIKNFEQFTKLRKEILGVQIEVNDILDGENHNHVISLANKVILESKEALPDKGDKNAYERFWRKSDPKFISLSNRLNELATRKKLLWPNPNALMP